MATHLFGRTVSVGFGIHVRGNKAGCPGCAISGFDQTKPGLLY